MGDQDKLYEKLLNSIQEANRTQTKEIKDYINSEVNELKDVIQNEQKERKELETKYEDLLKKYTVLEKKFRKNNIVIFGLDNEQENLLDYTVQKLNQFLKLSISPRDINNIFKISKKQNKPVVVQFVSFLTKLEVLRNCKNLKGTNISISEELSIEEIEKNRILRKHLAEARSKKLSAYIKNFKLYVSGEEYTIDQLKVNEINASPKIEENKLSKHFNIAAAANVQKRREEEKGNNINEQNSLQAEVKNKKIIPPPTTELENLQIEIKKTTTVPSSTNTARASARLVEKEKNSPTPLTNKVVFQK